MSGWLNSVRSAETSLALNGTAIFLFEFAFIPKLTLNLFNRENYKISYDNIPLNVRKISLIGPLSNDDSKISFINYSSTF
jgi:hypothetical protein